MSLTGVPTAWRNGGRRQGRRGEGGMFVHAGANRVSIVAQSSWRCRVCVRGSNCKAGPVPPSGTHGSGRAIRDSDSVGGFHVGNRNGLTTLQTATVWHWSCPQVCWAWQMRARRTSFTTGFDEHGNRRGRSGTQRVSSKRSARTNWLVLIFDTTPMIGLQNQSTEVGE